MLDYDNGKRELCWAALVLILAGILGGFLVGLIRTPMAEEKEVITVEETKPQQYKDLLPIFTNFKWDNEGAKNGDIAWNVERMATIVNTYPEDLKHYDRAIIVGGPNLYEKKDGAGYCVEINGNVISWAKDDDGPIPGSISGTMESHGATVLFTVKAEEEEIKQNITVVGSCVGLKDDIPYVMGVLR